VRAAIDPGSNSSMVLFVKLPGLSSGYSSRPVGARPLASIRRFESLGGPLYPTFGFSAANANRDAIVDRT
jgi:hypothetical protein